MKPETVLKPGDLVTFIEGDSWIFLDPSGEERKSPPLGFVVSTATEMSAVKVLWSTGELTMEWRSQVQLHTEYLEKKQEEQEEGNI